jgi:hypothetical protein
MNLRAAWPVAALVLAAGALAPSVARLGPARAASQPSPAAASLGLTGVPPGLEQTASAVSFVDANVGWLVVSASAPEGPSPTTTTVLGTTDAGATWRAEWRGVGFPGQLVAIDTSHAVLSVQGAPGCSAGLDPPACKTTLMATTDGGRAWAPVTSSRELIAAISFADPTTGLAAMVPHSCLDSLPTPKQPQRCPGVVALSTPGALGRRTRPRVAPAWARCAGRTT